MGWAALNCLRMEKMYRAGSELTNEVTLAEVGMLNFARLDKEYLGVEVNRREAEEGVSKWVLAYLKLDDEVTNQVGAEPVGGESVWFEGRSVGTITSGGYGYSVGAPLFFAFVKPVAGATGAQLEVLALTHLDDQNVLARITRDGALGSLKLGLQVVRRHLAFLALRVVFWSTA